MNAHSPVLAGILDAITRPLQATVVYPLYLASRIKRSIRLQDTENLIAATGDIESLGNSRYALPVTDTSGTKYRITIEVVS